MTRERKMTPFVRMEIDRAASMRRLGKLIPGATDEFLSNLLDREAGAELWQNNQYAVMKYEGAAADMVVHMDDLKGKCTYLSIRRLDRRPARSWADFYRIKNELTSPGREGIEIYPATMRLVNAANQYHLIVLPSGVCFPFGFVEGLI